MAKAAERRVTLVLALPVLQAGGTQTEAAQAAGVSVGWLNKLLTAHGSGKSGSALERCQAALGRPMVDLARERQPKPSQWEPILADAALAEELRSLYLSTMRSSSEAASHGRHTGSMSLALRRWAEHPAMPAWAATRLQAGGQPIAVLRWLRGITPGLEQLIRGERRFKLHGPTAQRDNTLRLPDGRRCRQLAGYRVVFDDMSVNQPFFTDIVEDGRVVDTILSRQGLYALDEATWRWLGCELVARPREAYRAEDVLRFVRRLMEDYGKFDCLVLEKGVWHARNIRGFAITPDGAVAEQDFERPGMDDEEQAILTRGLAAIGVTVCYTHSARGKTIEGAFSHLQPVIATMTREWQNIGAHAGEFERAAKQLRRARADVAHPEALKFAPMEPLADRISEAMAWLNKQPKDALGGSSPDAQWTADMETRRLPELAQWEKAVFLPETRERVIRGGAIHFTRSLTGYPFSFRAPDAMAALGDGYAVLVKFDPCDPALGAVILNNEAPGTPRNTRNFAIGQFICRSDFELCGPRRDVQAVPAGHVAVEDYYGLGPDADAGDALLRRQKAWHRTTYRSLPRPGQPAVRIQSVRDGKGNSATAGAPAAAPARRPARDLSAFDPAELSEEETGATPVPRRSAGQFDPAELSQEETYPVLRPRRSLAAFDPAELAEA